MATHHPHHSAKIKGMIRRIFEIKGNVGIRWWFWTQAVHYSHFWRDFCRFHGRPEQDKWMLLIAESETKICTLFKQFNAMDGDNLQMLITYMYKTIFRIDLIFFLFFLEHVPVPDFITTFIFYKWICSRWSPGAFTELNVLMNVIYLSLMMLGIAHYDRCCTRGCSLGSVRET
uniref:Uncharacterized protein n=1 Tax=Megaselia scalaris TaxID=36166 RepID=T1GU80_MEGSC